MTGKGLLSRYAQLAFFVVLVGALQLTVWLNTDKIARTFVKQYVPLSKEETFKRAVHACESSRFQPYFTNCSTPSQESLANEIRMHEAGHEYDELRPAKDRVLDVATISFGVVYAALAFAAFSAFKDWFVMNVWPRIAGLSGRLQTSLDLPERGAARRLRRAEEDFRTLKSLRDDGLITEGVFIARRDKLKAAIKVGATGK